MMAILIGTAFWVTAQEALNRLRDIRSKGDDFTTMDSVPASAQQDESEGL